MSKVRRIAVLLLASLIIDSVAARITFSGDTPGKLVPVRIGIASRGIMDLPLFLTQERGFFRDEGLDVELVLMKAIQTVQALVGGTIDFGAATGTSVSAAVNGADVRVVMAMMERPSFDLIAQPNITSVQQLRGKRIGVSAVGSLGEILARQILIAHQVPPDQVTILPLGISNLTYGALKGGVIEAIMAPIPTTFIAQDEGFRKLAAGGDFYRAIQGGLATTRRTISERPEVVTRAIRAILRALRFFKNNKKDGIEFIKGPFLELGRESNRYAERVYDAAVRAYLLSGSVDEKLQREMIADASKRVKPRQPVTPDRVFDFSFAHKISDSIR